jgi:hypothetical protein
MITVAGVGGSIASAAAAIATPAAAAARSAKLDKSKPYYDDDEVDDTEEHSDAEPDADDDGDSDYVEADDAGRKRRRGHKSGSRHDNAKKAARHAGSAAAAPGSSHAAAAAAAEGEAEDDDEIECRHEACQQYTSPVILHGKEAAHAHHLTVHKAQLEAQGPSVINRTCHYCSHTFSNLANAREHISDIHEKVLHVCPWVSQGMCGNTTAYRSRALRQHIKQFHTPAV